MNDLEISLFDYSAKYLTLGMFFHYKVNLGYMVSVSSKKHKGSE
jgi:hypothetical protein